MWCNLGVDNFLLQVKTEESSFKFYLTNLLYIWETGLTNDEILSRFKELNPLLDMPDSVIIDKVLTLYKTAINVTHDVKVISVTGNASIVSAAIAKSFTYKMELLLQTAGPEQFFHEFTAPILHLMKDFHEKEKIMAKIIEAKDVELEEYKLEGVELKRRGVITAPFCYASFISCPKECNESYDSHPATFLQGHLLDRLAEQGRNLETKREKKEVRRLEQPKKIEAPRRQMPLVPESAGCFYKTNSSEKIEPNGGSPKKKKVTKAAHLKL